MKKTSDEKKPGEAQLLGRSLAMDGRNALDMTPIPVSGQQTKSEGENRGRDAVNMTPLPGNPLEKGRGGAPMVPVPTTPAPAAPSTDSGTKKKP